MKLTLFIFFTLLQTLSYAQLLAVDEEWLTNQSFFNDSVLRSHNISAIHIWESEKKDGMHFKAENSFLHYEFNNYGQLVISYKAIPLKSKVDTAIHTYVYNEDRLVVKKSEKHGPFYFNFYSFYNEDGLAKELKVDESNNKSDTAFIHYFTHENKAMEIRTTTLNILHKPFLYLDQKYDSYGRLIEKRKSYHRNQSFTKVTYQYSEDKLSSIIKESSSKEEKDEIKVEYLDSKLNLVSVFSGNTLIKRYGFTYSEKGLPKAIIERNSIQKKIKIYRVEYAFFNQN